VQPQFGGQHRTGRPAPGNDHIEREWIVAGGRRSGLGDVALGRGLRRRLGGDVLHRCCPSGVPGLSRRSRRHLRQSPGRDGKGSTYVDTAFMGLTSSGGCHDHREVTGPSIIRSNPFPVITTPEPSVAPSEPCGSPVPRVSPARR